MRYAARIVRKELYNMIYWYNISVMLECSCLQDGFTALHLAAQKGKFDVVKLLTEAKADVNTQAKVYTYICHVLYTYLENSLRGECTVMYIHKILCACTCISMKTMKCYY